MPEEYKYLRFISYCLNEHITEVPDLFDMDWRGLYQFSQQQAITAIVLDGIDRLSNTRRLFVPQDLVFEWIGQVSLIESQNILVNQRIVELVNNLRENGKEACILKGQGNALMYPNPSHRTPGDIDVWLKGKKEDIVEFVHQRFPDQNVEYHHMGYHVFDDVEVEVHYYPSFCYNKWHNHQLLNFF